MVGQNDLGKAVVLCVLQYAFGCLLGISRAA
jgi:hypothetical protein